MANGSPYSEEENCGVREGVISSKIIVAFDSNIVVSNAKIVANDRKMVACYTEVVAFDSDMVGFCHRKSVVG